MSMAQDFKAFVMRGNVVDLAVGVIIGAAFGKIVSSMVDDVLMPPRTPQNEPAGCGLQITSRPAASSTLRSAVE